MSIFNPAVFFFVGKNSYNYLLFSIICNSEKYGEERKVLEGTV